jgi:hypothetical protein
MFYLENINFTKKLVVVFRDCDEIILNEFLKKIQKTLREVGQRQHFVYNCFVFSQGGYKWTVAFSVFPITNEQRYSEIVTVLVSVLRPLSTYDWGCLQITELLPKGSSLLTHNVCANSYKLLKFRLASQVSAGQFLSFLIASYLFNELVFDHKTKSFRLDFPVYVKEVAGRLTLFIPKSSISQTANFVGFIKAKTTIFGFVFSET